MTDAQRAHLRILEMGLPKRTHEAELRYIPNPNGRSKEILLGGVRYPSLTDAASAIGKSRAFVRRRISEGEGEYV